METQNQDLPPVRKRRVEGAVVAAVALLALSLATGVALYYRHQQDIKSSSGTNLGGFDIAQQTGTSASAAARAPAYSVPARQTAAPVDRGSLAFIEGGLPQSGSGPSTPAQESAASLAAVCRANQGRVAALAVEYTRRYPVIAQYGRDWMSYPDLRKLNDDYMRDRDPIAFIKGVAASRNFRILIRKYATQPAIQSFVKDVVLHAPANAIAAATRYIEDNQNLAPLTNSLLSGLGLPPALLNVGGSQSPQAAANSMLQSVLNNPSAQPQGQTPTLSSP